MGDKNVITHTWRFECNNTNAMMNGCGLFVKSFSFISFNQFICLEGWGEVKYVFGSMRQQSQPMSGVGVVWGGGVTRSGFIIRHTEEAFVGAEATL